MARTWSPEEILQIKELSAGGLSGREIAERMDTSRDAIIGVLRRIRLARKRPFRIESIPDAEATVRRLFAEGAHDPKIHAALGLPREVTFGTVRSYRLRLGLKHHVAPVPITEAEFESVAGLINQGVSAAQIRRQTGMADSRLRNLCIKFGLEIEGSGKRVNAPANEAQRWAKALSGKTYKSYVMKPCSSFRERPPVAHVPTQSSAGTAAL